MHPPIETAGSPRRRRGLVRAAAAILLSVGLGASGPAIAEAHGSGFHGGGSHGGGFHGGGFHGGFHAGGFHHGGGFHAGHFHGGFHGRYFHRGFGYGFYPGVGLGFALGAAYPWGWDYYPPAYGYYGAAAPYAAPQVWYYCPNPPGYYPYVSQCYAPWETVPAS